ncbi:LLM class flavin-dependent oxidoreductase [Campylobacter sp. MIT 21-1685]|uniref:LLM class flavin-dependent oxidoreductase n=1 Tax=unclassified Campylobacter TaxID=2593542 RepID=UPI00224B9FF9|nr:MULTISPECIES: LLM class flavin-dependent oxidoreductase [unclassified Campylobacter]MCX2682528.1 LLM class flavin-dependent oxidoreductase [Campylobacter sp. MIT 21-1684]MCX2750759.1 LLM class flavin-dependent oxidoreductase [Campylobacter sp. MIT 21-1682]MCX2807009.1 LLM class flavin-dependent oxidoreductase [Campylobacter sp. MIT 21-1685]
MKFGYWTPVFGSWLRNVDDDSTKCSWEYIKDLTLKAERLGYVLTLVPELYLNDIKGEKASALDAWAISNALAAITSKIEILAALRPQYHQVALTAKQIATISEICGGRFSINMVSAWWAEEARQYGINFDGHDDRYGLTKEYTDVLRGFWSKSPFHHQGRYFHFENSYNEPKPSTMPLVYAGGESEKGRSAIAEFADKYLMHGGTVEEVRGKIADMKARKQKAGLVPFKGFGMATYIIIRDTEEEALKELERITTIKNYADYENSYQNFTGNSELDVEISKQEYSVSNRGLRPNLVGTPKQVAQRIKAYEEAGLDLLIIQCANMKEELERIANELMPLF